jgi:hypothetical protein
LGLFCMHKVQLKYKKASMFAHAGFGFFGSSTWARTRDLRINRKPGL